MAEHTCDIKTDQKKKELRQQGTLQFPCALYHYGISELHQNSIDWHWHNEFEIIYIEKGIMNLQIPSRQISLAEGELAILNSNVLHSAKGVPECVLKSFVFAPELITGDKASVFAVKYITPLTGCREFTCIKFTDGNAEALFSSAFDAMEQEEDAWEFKTRDGISRLLMMVYEQMKGRIAATNPGLVYSADAGRLEQMMTFIHEKYDDDISLADIAGAAGIGEREALRCFKRTIEESPVQYLTHYRIRTGARLLLENPGESIMQIASECGFDSSGYFGRLFRTVYGCTPREYRKNSTAKMVEKE